MDKNIKNATVGRTNLKRIIRIFPRRTKATPVDPLVFVGRPPFTTWLPKDVEEIHVSCTFTWDKPYAAILAADWSQYYKRVQLGGPAYGSPAGEFTPGRYLAEGWTITSRGCPNSCSYCLVPEYEGELKTLEIKAGWNVQDNNLLACPPAHVDAVLDMLAQYPPWTVRFNGGLEPSRITPDLARRIADLRPRSVFLSFDGGKIIQAARLGIAVDRLYAAGMKPAQHYLACYVLVGYPGDKIDNALGRLDYVARLPAVPFPMFYRPATAKKRREPKDWAKALYRYRRPGRLYAKEPR